MSEQEQRPMPRWAAELGEEVFCAINDLLRKRWQPADIMRELALPPGKKRSLEVYASRFAPYHRVVAFGDFKDALLQGALPLGPKFMEAMQAIAEKALSTEIHPARQQRAIDSMIQFTKVLTGMMRPDEAAQAAREEQQSPVKVDPAEIVARMLEVYGIEKKTA